MRKFHKQQYKDENSKTPSDYICDFLNDPKNDRAALKLATYIQKIPNEAALFGKCLYTMEQPPIQLWVYSQNPYHLMYSYFPSRKEVCFLYALNGDPNAALNDAIQRVKNFYSIP